MSTLLRIDNFPATNVKARTALTADAAAGQPNLAISNGSDYAANDIVFVGTIGTTQVERAVVQSVTPTGIVLTSNLVFKHDSTEPVLSIRGDHVNLYRSANVDGTVPADGSFSVIATVTLNLAQTFTDYLDSTGGVNFWYKYTFTDTGTYESYIGDSVPTRGAAYGMYCSVDEVRNESGMANNPWIDNSEFLKKIKAAQNRVNGMLRGCYNLPFTGYIPDAIVYITRRLAAGYVLQNEYGVQAKGSTKDGQAKVNEAEADLLDIKEGVVTLMDLNGNSMRLNVAISSYPDNNTVLAQPIRDQSQDGVHLATIDDVY